MGGRRGKPNTFLLVSVNRSKKKSVECYLNELMGRDSICVVAGLAEWTCQELNGKSPNPYTKPELAGRIAKHCFDDLSSKLNKLGPSFETKVRKLKQMFRDGLDNKSIIRTRFRCRNTGKTISLLDHYGENYIRRLRRSI